VIATLAGELNRFSRIHDQGVERTLEGGGIAGAANWVIG
jgi:hypothetical protein